jgi:hypothetical protein
MAAEYIIQTHYLFRSGLFNEVVSSSTYIASISEINVYNILETMWMEAVVVVLYQHFPGRNGGKQAPPECK